MSRFTCYSKTFWDKAQNQNATYKSVTGISRGISLTLSLWRLSRKATLPVGNISWGPCKHTLSRHACESQPALLVQHRGKMASLTEERTGKLAAEAAPLLPWLQGWVTELGLPRLTAQHHVRPPLGRSLLPASAPVDTLSLWRMRDHRSKLSHALSFKAPNCLTHSYESIVKNPWPLFALQLYLPSPLRGQSPFIVGTV